MSIEDLLLHPIPGLDTPIVIVKKGPRSSSVAPTWIVYCIPETSPIMRLYGPIRTVSESNLEFGDLSGFAALDLVPLLGGPEPQQIRLGEW